MWQPVTDKAAFLREFVRNPRVIGAVAPSSRFLAEAMVNDLRLDEAKVVVEYGPGTGAFTAAILRRIRPDARFFGIELNQLCASQFRSRFPHVELVIDAVENVEGVCARLGIQAIDIVISGLPWAAFSFEQQERALNALVRVLAPDGSFATFAYLQGLLLPAGRRFRAALHRRFVRIRRSRVIWRNIPPAIVYRCTTPVK